MTIISKAESEATMRTELLRFNGAVERDPGRLLQGTGKFMRHVKLRPGTASNIRDFARECALRPLPQPLLECLWSSVPLPLPKLRKTFDSHVPESLCHFLSNCGDAVVQETQLRETTGTIHKVFTKCPLWL